MLIDVMLRRDTLRLWKICVDERKLHPTDISIHRHKRLARCIYVGTLYISKCMLICLHSSLYKMPDVLVKEIFLLWHNQSI